MDNTNKSYSIYPVDSNYKNVVNSVNKVNIISNINNRTKNTELINKEQICAIYLSDFTNILFDNYDEAYNILSEDMKKIYTSSDIYADYIDDNFELISSTADKCRLEEIDDKRVYTVIDSNENMYVFTEESIMNYKVDFYLKKVS